MPLDPLSATAIVVALSGSLSFVAFLFVIRSALRSHGIEGEACSPPQASVTGGHLSVTQIPDPARLGVDADGYDIPA